MTERTVVVRLLAQVGEFRAAMASAEAATRRLDSTVAASAKRTTAAFGQMERAQRRSMLGMGSALGSMRGMLVGFGVPLAIGAIAKSFLDFERQMAHVTAVADRLGRTAGGMKALRDAALSMGTAYGFSATEVAKAQEELLKAGRTTAQVLGGELNAALVLAAAGTISLDQSATILAVTLTQFSKEANGYVDSTNKFHQGTLNAAKVSDTLAQAANATVSNVSEMATALAYAGPVAASVGMSFEDTVTTLSLFNQAGIQADMAGTNLRGILTQLTSPSKLARNKMRELGITLYDTNGQFIGMRDLAEELHTKIGRLPPTLRNVAVGVLSTNAQLPGFITLMQGGAKAWDDMQKVIEASASAQEVARDKLNSLTGDLSKFGAEIQNAAIKGLSELNDQLSWLAHGLERGARSFGNMGGVGQLAMLGLIAQMVIARKMADRLGTRVGSITGNYRTGRDATRNLAIARGLAPYDPTKAAPAPMLGPRLPGPQLPSHRYMQELDAQTRSVRGLGGNLGLLVGQFRSAGNAGEKFATVLGGLRGGTFGGLNKAVSGLTGFLGGPWGVAITGALLLTAAWSNKLANQRREVEDLSAGLMVLGAAYSRTGNFAGSEVQGAIESNKTLRDLINTHEQFGVSAETVAKAASGDAKAFDDTTKGMQGYVDRIKDMRDELSTTEGATANGDTMMTDEQMRRVRSLGVNFNPEATQFGVGTLAKSGREKAMDALGDAQQAAEKDLAAVRKQYGDELDAMEAIKRLRDARLAGILQDWGIEADNATEAEKQLATAFATMAASASGAGDKVSAYKGAIELLTGVLNDATDAQGAFYEKLQDQDAFGKFEGSGKKRHFVGVRPDIDRVRRKFDVTSAAGRGQNDWLSGLASSAANSATAMFAQGTMGVRGKSQAAAVLAMQEFQRRREAAFKTLVKRVGQKDAELLFNNYFPKSTDLEFNFPGLAEGVKTMHDLGIEATMVDGEVKLVTKVDNAEGIKRLKDVNAEITPIKGTKYVEVTLKNPAELPALVTELLKDPIPVTVTPRGPGRGHIGERPEGELEQPVMMTPILDLEAQAEAEKSIEDWIKTLGRNIRLEVYTELHPPATPPHPPATQPSTGPVYGPPQPPWRGVPFNRWGAVHSYKAGGIHAKVGKGDLIRWAEPETGGEAYIPRRGDSARSKKILDTAAGWFGMRVVPMAGGGIVSMANGGVTLPLSDMIGQWQSFMTGGRFEAEDALLSYREALRGIADAQREVAASRRGVDDAKRGVRDAKENIAAINALPAAERHTNDMRDATEALAEAQQRLDDANRGVADSLQGVTDAMRAASRASAEYQATKVRPFEQLNKGLDLSIKYNAGFIGNLTKLSKRGFGVLANQLLQMGGPEAWKIASDAVRMTNAQLSGTQAKITKSQAQQSTLENMPAMNAIRAAITSGTGYGKLAGSGDFTAEELNRAINLMRPELQKTAAGRALLAAMSGHNETALRGDLRGYAAGGIAPPGTLYRFAEPSTGGEAVIPRFGAGAPALLSKAASWHGLRVSKPGWQDARMVAARPAQVQITVRGEGALSDMIQTTVDGRLVAVQRALTGGRLAG